MARRQPFIFTLFAKLIQYGTFEVRFANGEAYKAVGAQQGPTVIVSLPSAWLLWRFIWRADLAIPEAYMDGRLQLIDTSLEAFLRLLLMNKRHYQTRAFMRARIKMASFLCLFKSAIWQKQAKANVAHHYDLTDALYDCFLDHRRQYSCAYFRDGDDLDAAQLRKIARLAAKLDIKSGQDILDIGCGWGELARALTECEPDIKVTGITLSEQQLAYAKQHVLPRTGQKPLLTYVIIATTKDAMTASFLLGCLNMLDKSNLNAISKRLTRYLRKMGVRSFIPLANSIKTRSAMALSGNISSLVVICQLSQN